MRRLLRIISVALITAGAVVSLDIALTLAWGEPLSTLQGWLAQRRADDRLEQLEHRVSVQPDGRSGPRSGTRMASHLRAEVAPGDPIGRLVVPSIDLNIVAVEGTDPATLKTGPGRHPETACPGQGATVAVAGHRTTYLAPFRRINELGPGDEITLEMPYGRYRYRFQKQRIVDPYEVGVVRDVGYERLVLTACHPLYSAAQRIVVFARLADSGPPAGQRGGGSGEPTGSPPASLASVPQPGLGPVWAGLGGLGLIALIGFGMGTGASRRTGLHRDPG